MKKSAFTLVESMISLLIISAVGMAALLFSSACLKNTHERDVVLATAINNINAIETIRAEVKTLPQLYDFSQDREIKITAVGIGEIELNEDGTYRVSEQENNNFSESIKPRKANLFKIDIGGSVPNSKISTVVMLR